MWDVKHLNIIYAIIEVNIVMSDKNPKVVYLKKFPLRICREQSIVIYLEPFYPENLIRMLSATLLSRIDFQSPKSSF